jgi:hypothetical protein
MTINMVNNLIIHISNCTSLVWSSILPRNKWRYSENIRNMEITRKRVNRGLRSYLLKIGGYGIRHPDFDDKHPALLKKDGVKQH